MKRKSDYNIKDKSKAAANQRLAAASNLMPFTGGQARAVALSMNASR